MRLLKQLGREFWLPLLIGILWTFHRVQPTQPDLFGSLIAAFGPSFFLASWGVAQFYRVDRQHSVEDSFKFVERQLGELKSTVITIAKRSNTLSEVRDSTAALRQALDDITTLSNSASTGASAANTAMSEAIAGLQQSRQINEAWPTLVVRSTPESVTAGAISILAIIEVAFAVAYYWVVSLWLETYTLHWFSFVVAPLLLLRSASSTALGVRWTEFYVDDALGDLSEKRPGIRLGVLFLCTGI